MLNGKNYKNNVILNKILTYRFDYGYVFLFNEHKLILIPATIQNKANDYQMLIHSFHVQICRNL